MSRIANPSRDDFDAKGKEIWDRLSGARKGLHGPYLMLMTIPELADRVGQLGEYLRFHGSLDGRVRELAILATSRSLNVPFEWVMHEPRAVEEGLSESTIELLRHGDFGRLDERERLIADIVKEVCDTRQLSTELFQQGMTTFGKQQLVELIALINFYIMIAGVINCFEVSLPNGATDPFIKEFSKADESH